MTAKTKKPKRIRVMLTAEELHALHTHVSQSVDKYKPDFKWHVANKLAAARMKLDAPRLASIYIER